MFERFSEPAREVVAAAVALAAERGAATVEPEHLLAALGSSSGLGGELLAEVGVTVADATSLLPPAAREPHPGRPEMSGPARQALELSLREAINLAHASIGTGHLVLGLLRVDGTPASRALVARGADLEALRRSVAARSSSPRLGGRRLPRRTGRVVEALTAHEQASTAAAAAPPAAPADPAGVVEVLRDPTSALSRALQQLGVEPAEVEAAMLERPAGAVALDLGDGARLEVPAGARAAALRRHLAPGDLVDDPDGEVLVVEDRALAGAIWATVDGWLQGAAGAA